MKMLKHLMSLFHLDGGVGSSSGSIAGHEYVDLGLSVKWATCNIGADSPEDYGSSYAWGETSPKPSYTEENSKTYEKDYSDIAGNSSLDAATANWGSSWRLPTVDEIYELIETCNWTWTKMNYKYGYKFTSKVNDRSIFLPAAGFRHSSSLHSGGYLGFYWSSTPDTWGARSAYSLYLNSYKVYRSSLYRYDGHSVRPVSE